MPPARLPIVALVRSAKGVSYSAAMYSGSGMGQKSSPATLAASTTSVRVLSQPITAEVRLPSATIWAPVRVAMSSTASGFSVTAFASASAITRRPSASVLVTSTVLPLNMVITSLGRVASLAGRFSAIANQPVTCTSTPKLAAAITVPSTAAAPAISDFISGMEEAGLIDRPPESKVMPLPIRATWDLADLGW